jgi:hypothetical protein
MDVDTARVRITPTQALFYASKDQYFE